MTAVRQWRWPVALSVLTLAGLLAALLGEGGAWRPASWLALAVPLAVAAWCMWRPRRESRRSHGTPPWSHGT